MAHKNSKNTDDQDNKTANTEVKDATNTEKLNDTNVPTPQDEVSAEVTAEPQAETPTFSFQGQQTDEKVLFYGRVSGLIIFFRIIKMIILVAIFSLAVFGILTIMRYEWRYTLIGAGIFLIVGILFIRFIHLNSYLTITNQRVIVSMQSGLFRNRTQSANLSKIKETAFTLNGMLGSVLKFGNIIIQSDVEFADNRQLSFDNLSHVKDVKFFLDKLVALVEQGKARVDLPAYVNAAKGERY